MHLFKLLLKNTLIFSDKLTSGCSKNISLEIGLYLDPCCYVPAEKVFPFKDIHVDMVNTYDDSAPDLP